MSLKNKRLIDFPDGVLFLGPKDDPYLKKPPKKVDFQAALKYAKEAWREGREVSYEEMQQFVL